MFLHLRKDSPKIVEMRGIEPRAFHMQSERSTTELHPLSCSAQEKIGNGKNLRSLHYVFYEMMKSRKTMSKAMCPSVQT